jgi:hypothetical protein
VNLASDVKRKGARPKAEAESSDALERGALTRSSDEVAVMVMERRGGASKVKTAVNWETRKNCRSHAGLASPISMHEPYDLRESRTVLWAAGGEIPPADPATALGL